jgi:hypothetical protein
LVPKQWRQQRSLPGSVTGFEAALPADMLSGVEAAGEHDAAAEGAEVDAVVNAIVDGLVADLC